MKRAILLLTTLSFTACGPFVPQSGQYTITGVTLNEDACGFFEADEFIEDDVIGGEIDLTAGEEGMVSMDLGEVDFSCTLDGSDFACDDITTDQAIGETGDTTVSLTYAGYGSFASETELEPFTIDFSYACEGTDCEAYAAQADVPIPCTSGYSVTASTPEI